MRRIWVLLVLVAAAAGCHFEHRPEGRNDAGEAADGADTLDLSGAAPVTDSVRVAVQGFEEALQAGDLSRAVGALHERATLYDEESGGRWDPSQADSLLPGSLQRRGEQLQWNLRESSVTLFGEAALVVNRYQASISRESTPWTAMETYVLLRTPAGWRIRHLHRSRGLGPA